MFKLVVVSDAGSSWVIHRAGVVMNGFLVVRAPWLVPVCGWSYRSSF